MRTTLDLPEDLLSTAMKSTGCKTKTAVIIQALEEIIRKSRIRELKNFRGKIPIEIDLDTIRDRK